MEGSVSSGRVYNSTYIVGKTFLLGCLFLSKGGSRVCFWADEWLKSIFPCLYRFSRSKLFPLSVSSMNCWVRKWFRI